MSDKKAAAQLIRELKQLKVQVVPCDGTRCKVVVEGRKPVVIPGPMQKVSGRAILNARSKLRRELGLDV